MIRLIILFAIFLAVYPMIGDGWAQFNNDFGNNVKALTGLTGIDVNLGGTSVNVNLQGGEFLKMLASDIKQQLYTEISEDLKNYRPTSTGMENSGKVLPS